MKPIMKNIDTSEKLKDFLKKHNISNVVKLKEILGFQSHSKLYNWLNGLTKPSHDIYEAIAKEFPLEDMNYFFRDNPLNDRLDTNSEKIPYYENKFHNIATGDNCIEERKVINELRNELSMAHKNIISLQKTIIELQKSKQA